MHGHDRDLFFIRAGFIVHYQADMFEEIAERFVFLHRAGEFGQVFDPACRFRRTFGLQHGGVAAFIDYRAQQFGGVGLRLHLTPPEKVAH